MSNEGQGAKTKNSLAQSIVMEEVDFDTTVLSMPIADTSYTWAIPKAAKGISIKLRDPLISFRYAITTRTAAETTDSTDYALASAKASWDVDVKNIKEGNFLHFRSATSSQVAEIIYSF
jgi:hypothetical protein